MWTQWGPELWDARLRSGQRARDAIRHAEADHHWAAVSQSSQMLARSSRSPVRVRLGGWLVRAGLRLARPASLEHVLMHKNGHQVA